MNVQLNFLNVITTIRTALNYIDESIINHGDETAYIAYKIGEELGLNSETLKSLVIAAMFHDIGACKTDDLKDILKFENNNVNHSIYSYLFIKYFSPISHMANSILHHHTRNRDLSDTKEDTLANLIYIADSVSIMKIIYNNYDDFKMNFISKINNEQQYKKEYIDILINLYENSHICEDLFNGNYLIELEDYLGSLPYTQEEIREYIYLLVFSIDFRSGQTVTHSLSVCVTTIEICKLLGLDDKTTDLCKIASLLHDIGKISIPTNILKYPRGLSEKDFNIMKNHVSVTRDILEYLGNDKIKDIASNHHEKLNGKGYPRGLNDSMITLEDRILSVADIFVALTEKRYYKEALSKEEVISILEQCILKNELDSQIVTLVLDNYDRIINSIELEKSKFQNILDKINMEYKKILSI